MSEQYILSKLKLHISAIHRINHLFHISTGLRKEVRAHFREKKDNLQKRLLHQYANFCTLRDDGEEYLIEIPNLNTNACHIPKSVLKIDKE